MAERDFIEAIALRNDLGTTVRVVKVFDEQRGLNYSVACSSLASRPVKIIPMGHKPGTDSVLVC